MAEAQLSASAIGALYALQMLGLTHAQLMQLAAWAAAGDSVTLRLAAETRCDFAREEKREVEAPTKVTTERTSGAGTLLGARTTKVSTTLTDFIWAFEAGWHLEAFRGTGRGGAGDVLRLASRAALRCELKTAAKSAPHAGRARAPVETPLIWLLATLDRAAPGLPCRVRIDRARASCHTPRRNEEVAEALKALRALEAWARDAQLLARELAAVSDQASAPACADVNYWSAAGLLVPVVLLLDAGAAAGRACARGARRGGA